MADRHTNDKTTSQAAVTTVTTDLPYLAAAYGLPEGTFKELLVAPSTELVQQFLVVAQTIAQERDKLKKNMHRWGFPLMDLPPELRLKIYELFFQDALEQTPPLPARFYTSGRVLMKKSNAISQHRLTKVVELLDTSHAIRSEALPIAVKTAKTIWMTARTLHHDALDASIASIASYDSWELSREMRRREQKSHESYEAAGHIYHQLKSLGHGK